MKSVLFVCVHNAGRSQIAEAFFNQMARGKARALSAGTEPSDKVNPLVVEALREVGLDISRNKPKPLTVETMEGVNRIIIMGCGAGATCPATITETEDWDIEDPAGKNLDQVRKIRDEIKGRVAKLVMELTGS